METGFLENAVDLYFALAIGYNVLSLALNDARGRRLAPTDPLQGVLMMALLYLIYASRPLLGAMPWTALIAVFLLLILRFGIYRHIVGYNRHDYFSRLSWAAAILINIFGVSVLFGTLLT